MIVAGIDEAGYGPVLGPLVVGAAAFDVPDELADVSMWKLLSGALSVKPSRKRGRVAIADSKKLYDGLGGQWGLEHLERGVLAMLHTRGLSPRTLSELVETVAPGTWPRAGADDWHRDTLELPRSIDAVSAALGGNAIAHAMSNCGVSLRGIRCQVVMPREFNRLIDAVDNKSVVLFDVAARLLAWLWEQTTPDKSVRVVVDHQGGRTRYLPALQRVFEGCSFKVLDESERLSAYEMLCGQRRAEFHFLVRAEDAHLPVALASMTCKYLRELFMTAFNRYWATMVPGIKPTAGYYGDGQRFYREILPAAERLGVAAQALYRNR
jgi:ribonuclease HII